MLVLKITIAVLFILLVIGVIQSKRLEMLNKNIKQDTLVDVENEKIEQFDNNFLKFRY